MPKSAPNWHSSFKIAIWKIYIQYLSLYMSCIGYIAILEAWREQTPKRVRPWVATPGHHWECHNISCEADHMHHIPGVAVDIRTPKTVDHHAMKIAWNWCFFSENKPKLGPCALCLRLRGKTTMARSHRFFFPPTTTLRGGPMDLWTRISFTFVNLPENWKHLYKTYLGLSIFCNIHFTAILQSRILIFLIIDSSGGGFPQTNQTNPLFRL